MQQLPENTLLQGGRYKIERVLGQGGFGITYLATQELLDRKVCIKEFFFKEYCERDEATSQVSLGTQSNHELVERFMNKFLKEARTISQLDHRNIIKIHDIFKENNTAYYVMDYVEGESLNDMVNRRGALPEKEAVAYIERVADALKYIHQQNINHLDIKPSNIMIRQGDYRVILIDFGLSKQYDAQGGQTSTTPVGISHGYAPMEQYKQGGVSTFSPQTDIYALGATLYKLVTGNIPPQAMDILDEGLPSLPSSLSSSVAETIKKAMQPRKVDRQNSVDVFVGGLKAISQNTSSVEKEVDSQQNQTVEKETKFLNHSDIKTEEFVNESSQSKNTIQTSSISDVDKKSIHKKNGFKWISLISVILVIILFSRTCNNDDYSNSNQVYGDVKYNANNSKIIPIGELIKSSSTKMIDAPNYNGNNNEPSIPIPNIKKVHQKYIGATYDNKEWISSNLLELEETKIDAAPSFYNYNTLIGSVSNTSVPLQLGDKYLHIWKKDNNYNYIAYGPYSLNDPLSMRLFLTNNDNTAIVGDYQFDKYIYPPRYIESDKQFVNMKVRQFKVCDNILYFSHYHNTYAKSSCGMNGYITALNIETGEIVWTSAPLTCNSDFIIYDNYIITGYGFTDEPDYLYVLDKYNGAFIKKVSLANGPEIITMKDNHIFVKTYSYEYEFVIE